MTNIEGEKITESPVANQGETKIQAANAPSLNSEIPTDPKEIEKKDHKTADANQKDARRSAHIAGLIIIAMFFSALAWSAASDRYAPWSSRGRVMANTAQIAPRVPGRIVSIDVEDNGFVKANTPLFKIEAHDYEIALNQAKEKLRQAGQAVGANISSVSAAEAQVASARAAAEDANAQIARTQKLFDRGIVAKARLDGDKARADSANANVAAAIASAEVARNRLGEAGSNNTEIREAALAVQQAQYNLDSTIVRAPRDGYVTNVHISTGQFLAAGSPVITFVDTDAAWIVEDMRENELGNINSGDEVSIMFDAVPGEIFDGYVDSIGLGMNPGRQEAGGLPVEIPPTQWFEPARRMPVRINLKGGMENWPNKARLGGKVFVVVHAMGRDHPMSIITLFFARISSYMSYFY